MIPRTPASSALRVPGPHTPAVAEAGGRWMSSRSRMGQRNKKEDAA